MSLYTPQIGEISAERLTPADRQRVVADLMALRLKYPKLEAPKGLLDVYANPPSSPEDCVFSRTTTTISADLKTLDHPVPVRRRSGLLQLRLHRLGGSRGGGQAPSASGSFRWARSSAAR